MSRALQRLRDLALDDVAGCAGALTDGHGLGPEHGRPAVDLRSYLIRDDDCDTKLVRQPLQLPQKQSQLLLPVG